MGNVKAQTGLAITPTLASVSLFSGCTPQLQDPYAHVLLPPPFALSFSAFLPIHLGKYHLQVFGRRAKSPLVQMVGGACRHGLFST
jgi:hypothetical protein